MESKTPKIVLVQDAELAKQYVREHNVGATVEAEYGDTCVEADITLAHHGSRSGNPAPCNTDIEPQQVDEILVSHLDLDTVGGITVIEGTKPKDDAFWQGAELIDVKGPHHMHELPKDVQDKLNAYEAYDESLRMAEGRPDRDSVLDASELYQKRSEAVQTILDPVRSKDMIEAGRKWNEEMTNAVESQLVEETNDVRLFSTSGVFCNANYYSPNTGEIAKSVVSYNEKMESITVSMEDGGASGVSAKEVVQEL